MQVRHRGAVPYLFRPGFAAVGTRTCLVLSGAADQEYTLSESKKYNPDFVIRDISQLAGIH